MTQPTDARAIVRRYYLYRATATVGFVTPIFTIFLLRDLSFAQLGTLSGLFSALLVLGEIPTGYVGDRIGLRNSLVLGAVFKAASLVGFVVAQSFAGYLVLYVLWAAGLTFDSGALSAWLYEAIADAAGAPDESDPEEPPASDGGDSSPLDESAFTRVRGRGESVNRWTGAATMIAGGGLYAVDPRLPFLAATGWVLVGIPVLLTLPETEAGLDQTPVREVIGVLGAAFTAPPLRSVVAFTALAFGAISAAQLYVQPIAVDLLSGVDAVAGLTPEATLGLLYAAFTAVAAVASYHAETIRSSLGLRRALLAVPAFFAMKGALDLSKPLVAQYLNDRAGSAGRATVLSAAQMSYAVVRAPLKPLTGAVADFTTPLGAVGALGGGFLLAGTVLILVAAPVVETAGAADESPG